MATLDARRSGKSQVDIPFDSYAVLESRLQNLRVLVMNKAAQIAESDPAQSGKTKRVTVSRKHVIDSLGVLAKRTDVIQSLLKGEKDVVVDADLTT